MHPVKSRLLTAIQLIFLTVFAFSILRAPARACSLVALALQLWFEKMIPSLFPFMILSGLIVRLGFGRLLSIPIHPLLGRLYKINRTMCSTMLMGFLFGFPLGAKTVAEAYDLGQLSKPQAQYLLAFCNNIGPVYLLSFALPLLGLSDPAKGFPLKFALTAAFFGIPLLYGLLLRHTVYRRIDFSAPGPAACFSASRPRSKISFSKPDAPVFLTAASSERETESKSAKTGSFIPALDASVTSACTAITRLGGYMIFFIVCNLPFEQIKNLSVVILSGISSCAFGTTEIYAVIAPILEITSGLALSKDALPTALCMTFLTFGGLSCFAQTYTCIRDTDLSFGSYCFHKLLQSAIAFLLYVWLFSAFCGMPLSL